VTVFGLMPNRVQSLALFFKTRMPTMNPPVLTATDAFKALQAHRAQANEWRLRDLFTESPDRFVQMSLSGAGIFLDYSKNLINCETVQLLLGLARECNLEPQRDAMLRGDKINLTERRAALHTALRAPLDKTIWLDGRDVSRDVHAVLGRMRSFSLRVRSGQWTGYTGKAITDIVNIGIGGSDLGPKMVCHALRSFAQPNLAMHFVSNVDGHDLSNTLSKVNPETTLFIVESKTFTTTETMLNAQSARSWFLGHGEIADLAKHFVAVSTNSEEVAKFGIDTDNMFPFWDWVGGRYSVWSAVGLPIALSVGYDRFAEFLAGANAMDEHFRNEPLESNMPVLLGLIGIWNRNFLGCTSVSIAPYHFDLSMFPSYLQQLEMESNGKRVKKNGSPVDMATCPVIWGNVGTNGQHAYFQLLHQGTDITPIDFIAALTPNHSLPGHHATLLANCFAQSEAFMLGKTPDEVRVDLKVLGMAEKEIESELPHRVFPGNRPSNTILMNQLNPSTLGALIALYEHKTFVQGTIWDINCFDQWGVELGKVLSRNIKQELIGEFSAASHDNSTSGLIELARLAR
jgi:glucose-6-phosphate isomerase